MIADDVEGVSDGDIVNVDGGGSWSNGCFSFRIPMGLGVGK